MSEYANIESIEVLRSLRASLCKFADAVRTGLDEADAEIRRVAFWVGHEQSAHWLAQVRDCAERVTRAKIELMQRRSREAMWDSQSSCIDEKKALAAAQRRLAEAEERCANVKHWTRQLEKESFTYKAAAAGLAHAVEADVPNALARLDRMIAALEAYAPLQGSVPGAVASAAGDEPQDGS